MVEEDSGKGYVIKKGTYIGTHSGQVAEILSDRIVVEEEVEDIYGKISVRKREIKLKPSGEE
jgi:type IV pilus assembly protein PilP